MRSISPSDDAPLCLTFPDGSEFHTGYSRLSKFFQCPKQYKFTYVDKIRGEAGVPLRRGQAYHGAVEVLLNWKLQTGDLLPLHRADKLAIRSAKAENLSDREIYGVIDAVRYYWHEMYPIHQPLAVEKAFEIVRGGVKITGRIDLIETTGDVIDHKFSYDTWADSRAQYGCQPIIYQWAALDQFEKEYPEWTYNGFAYNIIRLFPSPVIQVIHIPKLDQASSDWWEEQLHAACQIIRNGFFPAIPSDKNCQYCDHKARCNPVIYKIKKYNVGDLAQGNDDEIDYERL